MAVIKDVAKEAGVSVSAVSKYLRTPEQMRPDTVGKIERAIRKLDYRPSPLARSLRTGKTGTISVVVPQVDNPFFSRIFETMHSLLFQKGFYPALHMLHTPEQREQLLSMLQARRVDGVIYFNENDDVPGKLEIPLVRIDFHHQASLPGSIHADLSQGMTQLCRHLGAVGVRSAAYVGEHPGTASSVEKLAAATRALSALQIDLPTVLQGYVGYEGGANACALLLDQPELPDALICETDLLAVGAMKLLRRKGILIPEQICVTGFDDTALAEMVEPELTTVRVPVQEICEKAVSMLTGMITVSSDAPCSVFATHLVPRASTKKR